MKRGFISEDAVYFKIVFTIDPHKQVLKAITRTGVSEIILIWKYTRSVQKKTEHYAPMETFNNVRLAALYCA